jgi:hypothetical protein
VSHSIVIGTDEGGVPHVIGNDTYRVIMPGSTVRLRFKSEFKVQRGRLYRANGGQAVDLVTKVTQIFIQVTGDAGYAVFLQTEAGLATMSDVAEVTD